MGYAENEPNEGDIFYTTEEPDKLFVNFLGIKLVNHRYKYTFPSKSLMHKHLKSNCVRQTKKNTAALRPAPVIQGVIKSTASIEAVRSGYAFKSWN